MDDLLIIVVNWNGEEYINECLKSVFAAIDFCHYKISLTVIDNNSNDKSKQIISSYLRINKIFNNDNIGFAAAINLALKKNNAKYYLLLNPDTIIIDIENFEKMINFLEINRSVSIAGCLIQNTDKTWQPSIGHFMKVTSGFSEQIGLNTFFHKSIIIGWLLSIISKIFTKRFCRFNNYIKEEKEVDFVSGAYFLIRKEVIINIGYLDETFYMFGEEIDYCKRAILKGHKTYYVPITKIIHLNNPSTNRIRGIKYYFQIVSYFIFFKKYDTFRFNLYRVVTLLTQSLLFLLSYTKVNRNNSNIHKILIEISLSGKKNILKKISQSFLKLKSTSDGNGKRINLIKN